ncbi:hypothetical protein ABZP36_019061 [Zizania latifolia]
MPRGSEPSDVAPRWAGIFAGKTLRVFEITRNAIEQVKEQQQQPPPPSPAAPPSHQQAGRDQAIPRLSSASTSGSADEGGVGGGGIAAAFDALSGNSSSTTASPARGKNELELDFRKFWEEFRSSSSEKEKERALNLAVDVFCRLVKQHSSVDQLVTKLVEAHVFAFVIGRAFVTDVEKLRIHSKGRSLRVADVIGFFSEITELGICPGSNLLYAVEVLVTETIDKQPLLDSGILCCLIYILNSLLSPDESSQKSSTVGRDGSTSEKSKDCCPMQSRRLEIKGSVIHIMKALASHPSAAPSLVEDDALQLLFHMVANGSLTVFSQFREGLVPIHTIQLHRHAMQVLGLLLANDNGTSAKYIRKHQLIKVLLMAVKDFNPQNGDAAYTMGIVDLLLECVELSYRPEAGSIKLREDIHNAHGYQFLVQFALTLCSLHKNQVLQSLPKLVSREDGVDPSSKLEQDTFTSDLSPQLSRLLDVLVNLSQTGLSENYVGKSTKSSHGKGTGHNRSRTPSADKFADDVLEISSPKVKDLEAIQMLQDIFLKADNLEVQAEVLNRMFKIFSSHLENYKLCQQLRTVPLFILNMGGFPAALQEVILKILEYAVTVVNCIPEQELLSLCCLLQQPISTSLKHTILSFFVKLLSFDQQYKKVLREVGVLGALIDDLKQSKLFFGEEPQSKISNSTQRMSSASSFQKTVDNKDTILSHKLVASASARFPMFEDEGTITVAWDCLFYLLKRAEPNQQTFRSSNGVNTVLPFLVSESHRSGVLRLLSCLIIEDSLQAHPEEIGSLIEILKSGMVSTSLGSQQKLDNDAKCDTFGALWRILGANSSAQRIFGEATGFSLVLTTLHSFQNDSENEETESSLLTHMKIFGFLMRAMTAAVCNNSVNRIRLHTILSSNTFYDLISESGLLCVDCEKYVILLLLELALEVVLPPTSNLQVESISSETSEDESGFLSATSFGLSRLDKERVYNASAVVVLIRSLLIFTPKVQLELLRFIEKLANAGAFNQENLTSVGCVGLLLETINPFLEGSSPILNHALRIVEVLGAYRLSSSELRLLVKYVLQLKVKCSGHFFVNMMDKLIRLEDVRQGNISLAPFIEMDMSKAGHSSIQVSLGERTWPPVSGYSFVCWFQFQNFFRNHYKEIEKTSKGSYAKRNGQVLRIFSVGAVDDANTLYAELYLHDNGVFTIATSNSSSLSFPSIEMEEGKWHHLAVVHSKPNALAGLFQASVASLYLDGKLRHTGKLGYSPSPFGKSLQVTLGTPAIRSKISDLSWRLRCCYLFEEVLTPGSICFMYILGQGYRGLFQDTDLLRFVPNQACGGEVMVILDSLEVEIVAPSSSQRIDSSMKQGNFRLESSGIVWDMERLRNLSLQLSGKKLIFAFDGTSSDAFRASGTLSLLNLVDPTSAAASPIGGIPRYGRLSGDVYVCNQCTIGDTVQTVGGMPVVLALVEAAETRDMLHMALELLALSLQQSHQNVKDMQALRGYHLLALFLHRRMPLFDMQSLDIFFRIAAREASFPEPQKSNMNQTASYASGISPESSLDDLTLPKFDDDTSSVGSHGDLDDFSAQKDSFSHLSELENADLAGETSEFIVLSNADMVEHVLLDWTIWVTAPISVQITLLGFLERMVSMHWFRNHNLTILRRINLVQHLLVTLQRGDVEIPVLEKLVVLLGVILEDGFLASELELVVRFVIMTFDPPELTPNRQIVQEAMGKHVIVRNMLLEMLIDLQVTINTEDLLEQWHKVVSSRLVTYFLDEAVHPTSMRWIMTLLGVCLTSSATFALKFRTSGGFQGLNHVLPSFYDSPEIYYILFCLVFGKPVYPRVPEVRMLDFHSLIPSDGNYGELKFVDLLDTIIAMAKATFDSLIAKSMLAHQNNNLSHLNGTLVSDLVESTPDMGGDLQGEALMHKTYAARLMSGEAAAPAVATSILRFMVDLTKMCPPFSAVCRRHDFLESCVDLYFSCVRSDCALKMAKDLTATATGEKSMHDDDNKSLKDTFSSLPQDQEQSAKTFSMTSFPQEQKSSSSGSSGMHNFDTAEVKADDSSNQTPSTKFLDGQANQVFQIAHDQGHISGPSSNGIADSHQPADSPSSVSMNNIGSPVLSERSTHKAASTPTASPMAPFTSWPVSAVSYTDGRHLTASPSMSSTISGIDLDSSPDLKTNIQGSPAVNTLFPMNSKLLLDIDDLGYGGGPCSAGATAVLDFIAQILADIISEQLKATLFIELILESVPLFVDIDSALVFQGLCLSRLMNFLERKLLLDDEEDGKKLDKSRWSANLDPLCWMIVDRVYMSCFPTPLGVLRTLEFLMSMLQLSNKDGRIEDAVPSGKGILSIARGGRQLDPYIHAILKNTNRMVMYCFLPTFLKNMGEDDLLANLAFLTETGRSLTVSKPSEEDYAVDICTVLQLLIANKRLVLCPSNVDTDIMCCFCINLMALLRDKRLTAQNLAVDLLKYLVVHRRPSLEDLLVSKPNQGQQMDILHGGLDKLLTGSTSLFFEWFQNSQQTISKVLDQCALIMWVQYITGSAKFPGVRIKGMEVRRKKEMGRKSREIAKLYARHWEQINERRYNLDLVRDVMSTELRAIRQDKYGWILHGESEWQSQLQQLVHERGIFPVRQLSTEPAWQLCAVEGPYRMRKKLEPSKFKIDTIQNVLASNLELDDVKIVKKEDGDMMMTSGSDTMSGLNLLTYDTEQNEFDAADFTSFKDEDDIFKGGSTVSAPIGWTDDKSSINEQSLHSVTEFGAKSSSFSYHMTESVQGNSELNSPRRTPSVKGTDARTSENKSEKELLDNGEYLIRPYLEPSEKIRHKYNCERVADLDKHDGIFLIGELSLYIIENFYIDDSNCICEKGNEDELSVIDQALGVKKDILGSCDCQQKSPSTWGATAKVSLGGRAWAYNGGAWGKEKLCSSSNLHHPWHMWKLDSVHELLKRDYQLRPVAIEIFSMDGCNELLVFHKKEREEVFKNLIAMNLPRNSTLDTTISASSKQDSGEGSRLFKIMAKSFSKRWQTGEITNFQYLMHLNTLAGRGYSDLTQYPVFPWVLADYESDTLDLRNPQTFRKLDKPMGCQTIEGEEEFRKRYDSWDDPEVPKFHYGSHYSSAGIILFYLLRLPPFSMENQKLQGGQFDHADRLFNSVRDTWVSAAGKSNTSDVKELIPEFYYLPEFLENRFNLDLGEKQSGEKVGDVVLPPWAKGSSREFIRKHREALESDYVSENLHHWIDLIFGYKQRGKAAEDAVNVFYHYTYEGNVDIDAVSDPTMKASILAQINHFGQTPKQLFQKPHPQRRTDRKVLPHPLRYSAYLTHQEVQKAAASVSQIVTYNDKILIAASNSLLKPVNYSEYISWGFPDLSLRILSYDQDRLLSTHENLHGGSQIQCTGVSHDGNILVTGGDDGVVAVWRFFKDGIRRLLRMEKALCAHTAKITCVYVSQPYSLIVSGSDDCSVILWDLTSLVFVKELAKFPASVSALHVNNLTGEILTGAGVLFAIWSINGDCLAVVNTSQLPSDLILSVASTTHTDWQDTNWYVTGHQSGAVKVWKMVHCTSDEATNNKSKSPATTFGGLGLNGQTLEYRLLLQNVLKSHKHPVTALCLPPDLKQLLSGDASGHLFSWSLKDDSFKVS